jgi:signal transduction histidine kinase
VSQLSTVSATCSSAPPRSVERPAPDGTGSHAAAALLAAAALVLASAAFVVGRDVWPGAHLTELLALVALICIAPFAIAFAAGRRRDAVATRAPSSQTTGVSAEATPAVRDVARMALENERLETELSSTLSELRASRLRILSAADRERRRIERDLHDGAQQRLVALGIQLVLAAELVDADPGRVAGRLRELAHDVDEAVDEVRALARGLVPPMLVERGLAGALRDAAATSPLIARVQAAAELGRYAPELESAVYFCCLEALQNAAKHADQAHFVTVRLWEEDELHFEVRDDGAGLPNGPRQHGAGLTNMRDRIGAVGGRLTIESGPGEGTCVAGTAPLQLPELSHQPRP